jgi:outer membrane protein assembly factor BamE (lipoprotein component of BamABCDE complex)
MMSTSAGAMRMDRAMLIALVALAIAVAAMVVAITRHENPAVAKLEQFDFPPPLNQVRLGETPAQVRRVMGPPRAVRRYASPPELCWDYVFPTSTPHYRLCFEHGRLVTRTPI